MQSSLLINSGSFGKHVHTGRAAARFIVSRADYAVPAYEFIK